MKENCMKLSLKELKRIGFDLRINIYKGVFRDCGQISGDSRYQVENNLLRFVAAVFRPIHIAQI